MWFIIYFLFRHSLIHVSQLSNFPHSIVVIQYKTQEFLSSSSPSCSVTLVLLPWILKRGWLETYVQRIISLKNQTKKIAVFWQKRKLKMFLWTYWHFFPDVWSFLKFSGIFWFVYNTIQCNANFNQESPVLNIKQICNEKTTPPKILEPKELGYFLVDKNKTNVFDNRQHIIYFIFYKDKFKLLSHKNIMFFF